jgi:hypothetical protein
VFDSPSLGVAASAREVAGERLDVVDEVEIADAAPGSESAWSMR